MLQKKRGARPRLGDYVQARVTDGRGDAHEFEGRVSCLLSEQFMVDRGEGRHRMVFNNGDWEVLHAADDNETA